MTIPSFEDAPTIVWPPDPRDLACSEETTHHGRNGTLVMPAFEPPQETTVDGAPSAQIRHQLDEMSLVLETATLQKAEEPVEPAGPAPAGRRLTFAALRALPARASTLPPAPARSTYTPPIQARPTAMPSRIEGIPILSIGDAPPPPAPAPVAEEVRAQFDSLAPTAAPVAAQFFPVHAVEVPPRAANQGRWLQLVAACTFLAVLGAVGVLRATNRIGPRSAPIAAEAPVAPRAPAAQPSPPAEEPAAAPTPEAAAEDIDVEPAPTATAAARPSSRPARAATPAQKAKDHDIQVDSLFYGHGADERSVTLQLDGQSVILREGDVAEDLQVEKILPDGVIFRRGKRLFAVYNRK